MAIQARAMVHAAHLVWKQALARANTALLLSLVCGGLAACAFGAVIFDVSRWFAD